MTLIQNDIKAHFTKRFVSAICNHDNDLVLEYLKNGMSATKECMGDKPIFYAIAHNNFGAILLLMKYGATLEKEYLEDETNASKEILEFLISLL
ncbi:hypothetical protein [Campylobacter jejuni]|uniref:hypothetical protein n=1 Tax=Campylobacter jejuni TaxID=197 RepID=UPI0013770153|nr:hypothetical protein [Campylobacter jejuni]NBE34208.1 hypothetical protein [Campylobacter jejuni]NBE86480.1 hypothetical protein [Campylobacter jejuni]